MIKINNKSLTVVNLKKFIFIILAIIRGISCVYLVIEDKVSDGAYHSSVSSSYRGYAYRESITYDVFEGFSGGCMIIMLVLLVISILTIIKALFSKKDENGISCLISVISRILIYVVGIVMFSYQSNHFSWLPIGVGIIDVIATGAGFFLMGKAFEYQEIHSEPVDNIKFNEIYKNGSSNKNQTNRIETHKAQNGSKTMSLNDNDCAYCEDKHNISDNYDNRNSVVISKDGIRKCGYCNCEMKDSIYCYNCGKYNKK